MKDLKTVPTKSLQALRPEKGAAMTEYVLIVGLIAVVCILGLRLLGEKVAEDFNEASSQL
jgi:Flp pilus assembly pilin Flp